jgi:hypothetical protein
MLRDMLVNMPFLSSRGPQCFILLPPPGQESRQHFDSACKVVQAAM